MLRARADQAQDTPFSSMQPKPTTATDTAPAEHPFSPTKISGDVRNLSSPKPRSTSTPPASNDEGIKRSVGRPRTRPFGPHLPPASFRSPKAVSGDMEAEAPVNTLQSPMSPDPLPDMTEIRRVLARNDPKNRRLPQQPDTKANNEEGGDVHDGGDVPKADEKESEEPTVYMAWTHPVQDTEPQFIIDTGCLGSHIFKGTELLTRVHKSTVPVRDF